MHHWIKCPNGHHVFGETGFGVIRTGGRYYVITIGGGNWAYWTDPATGRRYTSILAHCKAQAATLALAARPELFPATSGDRAAAVPPAAAVARQPTTEVARLLGRLTKGAARHLRKTLRRLGRPDLAALPRVPA